MSEAVPLPDAVAGVRWRAATPADADPAAAFVAAVAAVDEPSSIPPRRSVAAVLELAAPDGAALLAEQHGELVAFGVVQRPSATAPVRLSGWVLPSHRARGIGRALLAAQVARGRAVAPAGQPLTMRAPDRAPATARLAERSGFVPERTFLHLTRAAVPPPGPVPLPEGLAAAAPDPAADEGLRLLKNAVFADHWRPHVETPESWAAKQLGPQLRRDLSRVALRADGSPAGFVLTWIEDDRRDEAYIALVGTSREWRGRGVARSLLSDVLRAAGGAGLRRIVIDVDGASPTHADRLYVSLGFERMSAATVWALQP